MHTTLVDSTPCTRVVFILFSSSRLIRNRSFVHRIHADDHTAINTTAGAHIEGTTWSEDAPHGLVELRLLQLVGRSWVLGSTGPSPTTPLT